MNEPTPYSQEPSSQELFFELISTIMEKNNWYQFKEQLSFLLKQKGFNLNYVGQKPARTEHPLETNINYQYKTPLFYFGTSVEKIDFLISNNANMHLMAEIETTYCKNPVRTNLLGFLQAKIFHVNHVRPKNEVIETKNAFLHLLERFPILAFSSLSTKTEPSSVEETFSKEKPQTLSVVLLDKIIHDFSKNPEIFLMEDFLKTIINSDLIKNEILKSKQHQKSLLQGIAYDYLWQTDEAKFQQSKKLVEYIFKRKILQLNDKNFEDDFSLIYQKFREHAHIQPIMDFVIKENLKSLNKIEFEQALSQKKDFLQNIIVWSIQYGLNHYAKNKAEKADHYYNVIAILRNLESYTLGLTHLKNNLQKTSSCLIDDPLLQKIQQSIDDFEQNSLLTKHYFQDKANLTPIEFKNKYFEQPQVELARGKVLSSFEQAVLDFKTELTNQFKTKLQYQAKKLL